MNITHWQLEWRVPISMGYVTYAREFLKHFPFDDGEFSIIDRAEHEEGEIEKRGKSGNYKETVDIYILHNVIIQGYTDGESGAVFFSDIIPVHLHYSSYSIFFSVPKSCVIDYETQTIGDVQTIRINEWAYNNCYLKSLLRILENFGYSVYKIITGQPYMPMVKFNPYFKFRKEIRMMDNEKKQDNKKKTEIGKSMDKKSDVGHRKTEIKHDNNNNTCYVFFTDGKGNLYNNEKRSANAHFSILLENSNEKWKHKEDALTNNQAEILGVMSALYIASKRKYTNVEIKIDSQNVVKWINGKDSNIKTNIKEKWNTKDQIIETYINKLIDWSVDIPNITITWINRDRNKAHPI